MRTLMLASVLLLSPAVAVADGVWPMPAAPGAVTVSYSTGREPTTNDIWATCRGMPSAESIASCTDIIQRRGLLRTRSMGRAYYYRGRALFLAGDNHAAISDLNQALRFTPTFGDAYMIRGSAFAIDGDLDAALADFTSAMSIIPDDPQVHLDRGRVYLAMGNLERASADIERAIELDPTSAAALAMRGAIREHQGRPRAALADFDAALAIDPNQPIAVLGHARLAPIVQ